MALATIRDTKGQGNAALYVRVRDAIARYWNFATSTWVGAEAADCKVLLAEYADADAYEARYSANYVRPSGEVIVEYVRVIDNSVIGEESFSITDAVALVLTGSGANAVAITARDAALTPVAGARVQAWNGAALVAMADTDADGDVTLGLPNGSFDIVITRTGYSFPRTTVVVDGAETVAVTGVLFAAPPPPPDPTLCHLYEFLRTQDGQPRVNAKAMLKIAMLPYFYVGALYSGAVVERVSNAEGLVYWDVPQGAEVLVQISEFGVHSRVRVPALGTAQISSLPLM